MDLNKEQIKFLNECTEGEWTFNEKTGLVDIKGDFDCSREKLTDFKGVRFGVVTGNFYCYDNNLTSLEGAPQKVGGDFRCHDNKLTSLVGAPQEVEGDFSCSYNKLTSLEGAPQVVEGSFDCSHNSLTSLVGAPQVVEGSFYCHYNSLTSLVGAPQKVGWDFICDYNMLKIPQPILRIVIETMLENKVDYYFALFLNKEAIDKEINKLKKNLEKMESILVEIDANLSKDSQKGISMMGRFGHFD